MLKESGQAISLPHQHADLCRWGQADSLPISAASASLSSGDSTNSKSSDLVGQHSESGHARSMYRWAAGCARPGGIGGNNSERIGVSHLSKPYAEFRSVRPDRNFRVFGHREDSCGCNTPFSIHPPDGGSYTSPRSTPRRYQFMSKIPRPFGGKALTGDVYS